MKTFNLRVVFAIISSFFFVHFGQAVEVANTFAMNGQFVPISEEASRAIQRGYLPIYVRKDAKAEDFFKITIRGYNKNFDRESTGFPMRLGGYMLMGLGRPDSVMFDVFIYGKRMDTDHLSEANETATKGPYKFLKGHILNQKSQKRIEISYTLKVQVIDGELKVNGKRIGDFEYYLIDYKDILKKERVGFDFHTLDEHGKADNYAKYTLIDY